jgi:hypothetical protein
MNADFFLDEPVAGGQYPDGNDGRQQYRKATQKVGFKVLCNAHICQQQSFAFIGNLLIFAKSLEDGCKDPFQSAID